MHCLVDRDIVAFPSQKESRRQSGRTAANDRDLLAGRWRNLRNIRILFQILQSGKSLQVCDRDRRLHILSSAVLLTRMRADRPDTCRQRKSFFHDTYCIMIVASADSLYIGHAVCSCRTAKGARSFAVAVMITHQKFQRDLPCLCHTLGIGI